MLKFLENLGNKYFNFFKYLNLILISLMLVTIIYLRSLDLYYLLRSYNGNMTDFWYFIVVIVISSLILLLILTIYYLKNGINTRRGIILVIIFMLSPLLTIIYSFFSNVLDTKVTGFFTQSFYVSIVMVALSYAEEKITQTINGT